jgi:predicted O-methyltransferase YrrM
MSTTGTPAGPGRGGHRWYGNRPKHPMSDEWTRNDLYQRSFLHKPDPALENAVENSKANELPEIAVSETQGKFLNLLARSINAKNILEVGTLGGCVFRLDLYEL